MIILKDTMLDGTTRIDHLDNWKEAEELFETASQSPRVLACTIRDLETGRYKTATFSRPGIGNMLREFPIEAIPLKTRERLIFDN